MGEIASQGGPLPLGLGAPVGSASLRADLLGAAGHWHRQWPGQQRAGGLLLLVSQGPHCRLVGAEVGEVVGGQLGEDVGFQVASVLRAGGEVDLGAGVGGGGLP